MASTQDDNTDPGHIHVLGGGMAGLAAGYYAAQAGLPFTVYEAGSQIGGNCITFRHGEFQFDSGAHRFHDQDREITRDVQALFGRKLKSIHSPSHIYHREKLIDFPLSPLNLARKLGPVEFTRAAVDVIRSRLSGSIPDSSFATYVLHTYGKVLTDHFLWDYSEKLWGVPCDRLSADIAGKRLRGLTMETFFKEAVFGKRAKTEHMDGAFFYPRDGIGAIPGKLAESFGPQHIQTRSVITNICHDEKRIREIEINGQEKVACDTVISTIPLSHFIRMLSPAPPDQIRTLAKRLRYRHMVLAALFLDRETVTRSATVYFPDSDTLFTRISEPIHRSGSMAPPGRTSLVAEIPCQQEDPVWKEDPDPLIEKIANKFAEIGWIRPGDIIDSSVEHLEYTYPILEIDYREKVDKINSYLAGFDNLKISGRCGRFVYSWIHDMMRFGREIIQELIR